MIREVTATGSTVEEARDAAVQMLSAGPEDDVQFEIIDLPQKKTLGLFGGCPAKVRAYIEEEVKPTVQKAAAAPRKPTPKKAPYSNEAKKEDKPTPRQQSRTFSGGAGATAVSSVDRETRQAVIETAVDYLSNLLKIMEVDCQIEVNETETHAELILTGEGLGTIVGRRGETLDSLQYLTVLAANRHHEGYYRVTLNTGNYREKRAHTLQQLARRMATQAIKNGRNAALESMNPYERRIIHTAVQDVKGAASWSVGEEPNRRVIIGLARGEGSDRGNRRPPRKEQDRPYGGRDNRPRHPHGPNKTEGSGSQRVPHSDANNLPLYGRVEKND